MVERLFGKIFNIRSNEWSRFLVLYGIALLFFTGITWGETIIEAAFLHQAGLGVQQLPLVFTLHAIVQIISTAAYVAVADRVSNSRLLILISAISALSVAVGLFMLEIRQEVLGYLALYVLVRVIRGVFTLHWWTYVSDFYDTQASKRIVPVLNSVTRIGIIAASLSMPVLTALIAPIGIIILWMISLLLVAVVVWLLPYLIKWRRPQSTFAAVSEKTAEHSSYIRNIREGYQFVAQSPFLRWMAVSTLLMVVIFAILNTQPSATLQKALPTVTEYSNYIGVLNGVAGLILLPLQLFLLSRVINWVGVGTANLIFPALTTLVSGLLLGFPSDVTVAGLGYLDRTAVRLAVREPTNNLLFNAVPARIKGRARAFIDGLIVPVGLLLGSGLLVVVPAVPIAHFVLWTLVALSVAYLFSGYMLRGLYSKALISTLEGGDFSAIGAQDVEDNVVSPEMMKWLTQKLAESKSQELQVFIARMMSEMGGEAALPTLKDIARSSDSYLRLAIVDILVSLDMRGEAARQFFMDFLKDDDWHVRRSAAQGLEEALGTGNKAFLKLAHDMLTDPQIEVRAQVIPALLRSNDPAYKEAAEPILDQLLAETEPDRQIQGLQVLRDIPEERFIQKVLPYLRSEHDRVRLEAVLTMEALVERPLSEAARQAVVEPLVALLRDPFELVRELALRVLGNLPVSAAYEAIIQSLVDSSPHIREVAVDTLAEMGRPVIPLLNQHASQGKGALARMSTVVLSRVNARKYGPRLEPFIEENLRTIYRNVAYRAALASTTSFSGLALAADMLLEQNSQLTAEIFYLLSSMHGSSAIRVVAESLRSSQPHVRSNAIEALESMAGTSLARLITNLSDPQIDLIQVGQRTWNEEYPTIADVIRFLLNMPEQPWMRMAVAFGLAQMAATVRVQEQPQPVAEKPRKTSSPLDLLLDDAPKKRKAAVDPLAALLSDEEPKAAPPAQKPVEPPPAPGLFTYVEIRNMLRGLVDDVDPDVREIAAYFDRMTQWADLSRLAQGGETMLSAVEKMLFLKEVSFFQSMTVEQLKVLAAVCEEQTFEEEQVIFEEGDPGDALYVIVQGKVAIERESERKGSVARLSSLEERAYFGEMTLFNGSPRSTRALALKHCLLLRLRREPVMALIRQYPDLSLNLINVLSDRLREANEQIVQLTKSKPRELHKLYDKLD
jgi:HEAT repeat protein